MEETATISLKRLKELEKYEESVKEKKVVLCYRSYGNFFSEYHFLLNSDDAVKKVSERIEELEQENKMLKNKLKSKWF